MATYAKDTEVSPGRSREEIERTLSRYGATAFGYAVQGDRAMVEFIAHGYRVRFLVDLPDPSDRAFTVTESGRSRQSAAARGEYEKAVRQRWRVLALITKAKLEAVAAGVVAFEREFLPYMVLPSGETVGDAMVPRLAEIVRTGEMPSLLADYTRLALPPATGR